MDPDYLEKLGAIKTVLANLADDEAFFSIDELGPVALRCAPGDRCSSSAKGELLVSRDLTASKGEATRLIRGGGVYVNNRRITDDRARLHAVDAIDGRLFALGNSAQQNHVVKVVLGRLVRQERGIT